MLGNLGAMQISGTMHCNVGQCRAMQHCNVGKCKDKQRRLGLPAWMFGCTSPPAFWFILGNFCIWIFYLSTNNMLVPAQLPPSISSAALTSSTIHENSVSLKATHLRQGSRPSIRVNRRPEMLATPTHQWPTRWGPHLLFG